MSARSSLAANATVASSKLHKASSTVQVFIHFMAVLLPSYRSSTQATIASRGKNCASRLGAPGPVGHTRRYRALLGSIPEKALLFFCQNERGGCNALILRALADTAPERLRSVCHIWPAGMNFACSGKLHTDDGTLQCHPII